MHFIFNIISLLISCKDNKKTTKTMRWVEYVWRLKNWTTKDDQLESQLHQKTDPVQKKDEMHSLFKYLRAPLNK